MIGIVRITRCLCVQFTALLLLCSHWSSAATLSELFQQTNSIVQNEQTIIFIRSLIGTDVQVSQATALSPGLLGAGTKSFDPISVPSRKINVLASLLSQSGLPISLASALQTPYASQHGIVCPFTRPSCSSGQRYRSADGKCNNLGNPLWGSSVTPMKRLLPAVYGTDTSKPWLSPPRSKGVNGVPLASPRAVSVAVHLDHDASSLLPQQQSLMYNTFGQFVAHDVTNTPAYKSHEGAMLSCCAPTLTTGRCAPITIATNDPFHSTTGRRCMGFARSVEVTDLNCEHGIREQVNLMTSFVDGSGVYGQSDNAFANLREFTGGRLKTSFGDQFPIQSHANQKAAELGINYFKAGDPKVSEWLGLTGITLAFLREHNRIAGQLTGVNPTWNDEKLFQESRRIVIAMLQHIVYSEYLPITIGPALMSLYSLWPRAFGHTTDYNPTVDPSMLNVFATAADRFGHTMTAGSYRTADKGCMAMSHTLRLRDVHFRSNFYLMHEHPFMRDQVCSSGVASGAKMAADLKHHMFQTKHGNGVDLASMNIQRGRDHGLPSYNNWRRYVPGLQPASSWTTNSGGFVDHETSVVARLASVYNHPEDVDVWTGAVSEKSVPGGTVGPLFGHLLAIQFKRLKIGDRYWYETIQQPQAFTSNQLNDIRAKSSLAKILCSNFDMSHIQSKAFLVHGSGNPRLPCASYADLNWSLWTTTSSTGILEGPAG